MCVRLKTSVCSGRRVGSRSMWQACRRSICHHIHVANRSSRKQQRRTRPRIRCSLLCGDVEVCFILRSGRLLLCANQLSTRALNSTGASSTGLAVSCVT